MTKKQIRTIKKIIFPFYALGYFSALALKKIFWAITYLMVISGWTFIAVYLFFWNCAH